MITLLGIRSPAFIITNLGKPRTLIMIRMRKPEGVQKHRGGSGFNFESAFGYAQSSKFALETGYERARTRDLPDLPNLTVILRLGLASREPRDANPL